MVAILAALSIEGGEVDEWHISSDEGRRKSGERQRRTTEGWVTGEAFLLSPVVGRVDFKSSMMLPLD
ncbi:hypothetical protein J1N35_001315 [Gossypium stocksii]|uniref:Uncharacterized protein n=1 Tax=Gossypium stocksii TaxID=47602 RepID=A0A9D3WIQ8_9ROSI|nr:hypothetical protein J1N35_001315 [Gossypium stocksii]